MKHPTREECERLLREYQTPEHVRRHCRAVAETAYTIGAALNKKGLQLDLELIVSAGLLHDIARVEDKHEEAGAVIIREKGFDQEADIIKAHTRYDFSCSGRINETDLVCLGDRLVLEDAYAGLDARIDYIIKKAARHGHPESEPIIRRKKQETRLFMNEIERILGCSIDDLMKGKA